MERYTGTNTITRIENILPNRVPDQLMEVVDEIPADSDAAVSAFLNGDWRRFSKVVYNGMKEDLKLYSDNLYCFLSNSASSISKRCLFVVDPIDLPLTDASLERTRRHAGIISSTINTIIYKYNDFDGFHSIDEIADLVSAQLRCSTLLVKKLTLAFIKTGGIIDSTSKYKKSLTSLIYNEVCG